MKTPEELNSGWRKVASSIYRRPTDSKIFGSVEMDITDLEKYIAEKRKNGVKVTLTHVFIINLKPPPLVVIMFSWLCLKNIRFVS